jgi:threonylcarbamoyladenosine tRNA methylthiotransferase MtaB
MPTKKIAFTTLGCRYNRMETAELAHEMDQAGYRQAPDGQGPADVVVINTCAVTHKSAAKSRAAIRDARAKNPGARVVVTGCYTETDPEAVARIAGVDLALGNKDKFRMAEALQRLETLPSGGPMAPAGANPTPDKLPVRPITGMAGRTNAYLNVQSGCDEVCSFCIVKTARGKSRSASSGQLVDQAKRLCAAGIKEIVISGINVGQYGGGAMGLAGLVAAILKETDIARVRLSSVNPTEVTDGLIGLMASEPRFAPHMHIPLQSGSDKILALMRRPYTSAMYEDLLCRLAERVPGIGLGADVMTGFPGETEEDYALTRSLIGRLPLMMLHVFPYSRREGTEAALMSGAVGAADMRRRTGELKAISSEKRLDFMARHEGKELSILVESSRSQEGALKGFAGNYIPATLKGPDSARNTIVRAVGEKVAGDRLHCRIV